MTPEEKEDRRKKTLHLALCAQDGDIDSLDELCDILYPLMRSIRSNLSHRNVILPMEVMSLGREGVINALTPFDREKSNNFGFYCYQWIRNVMEYEIRDRSMPMHIPASVYAYRRRCFKAIKKLNGEGVANPSQEDIAQEAGLAVTAVKRVMNAPTVQSISSIHKEIYESGSTMQDVVEDILADVPSHMSGTAIDIEYVEYIMDRILSERDADMVRKMYGMDGGKPWTLEQVAAIYERSHERVRQIVARSLRQIKRAADSDGEL